MISQLTHRSLDNTWKQPKGRNVRITEPPWVTPAQAMLLPLMCEYASTRRGGLQGVAEGDRRDITWVQTSASHTRQRPRLSP